MGVFVTPQSEIDAYYASEALGQSKAKIILKGLDQFTAEQEDINNKPHIILGKAVDMLLTGAEEEFNQTYYVSKLEKIPTDAVSGIINQVFNQVKNNYLLSLPIAEMIHVQDNGDHLIIENDSLDEQSEIKTFTEFAGFLHEHEELILQACAEANYQPRWGAEAKLKAIVEPGSEYFKDICKAEGKTVIDVNTHNTILSVVQSLKTHPRTSRYFDKEMQAEQVTVDFYYQLPIYFQYYGMDLKALLDLVVVIKDINGDILKVEPIDLKTMYGNTFDFPTSIKSHRYDIQAAWYTAAIYAHFFLDRENEELVAPFKFIVESTSKQGKPLIFEMTREFLNQAREGVQASANYYISGMNDILQKIQYHIENGWELEQEIQEADEKVQFLQVGLYGIIS